MVSTSVSQRLDSQRGGESSGDLWQSYLTRTRRSVLGRLLVACRGAGGLRLMDLSRVVGEGLWSYTEKEN